MIGYLRHRGELWYLQWALSEGAVVEMAAGHWEAAESSLREVLDINRRIGDRGQRSHFLAQLGWIHRSRGDYGVALRVGEEAVAEANDVGHVWWQGWSEAMLGWTLLDVGAATAAVEHLQRGLAAAAAAGSGNFQLRCAGQLARGLGLAGDEEGSARMLVETSKVMGAVRTPSGTAFLHGGHAYVDAARAALALGQPEQAIEMVTPIVGAARAHGWKEVLASALLVLGRAARHRATLEEALAVAETADLPGVAWQALAALARPKPARALLDRLATTIDDRGLRTQFMESMVTEIG